jgi:hypothetical protein
MKGFILINIILIFGGPQHDRLWNQLEAEIHLNRHKTIIKAVRYAIYF